MYDLVSTLVYGDAHMALELDGRDQNLTRANFVAFGARFGLRAVATERMLTRVVTRLRRRLAARGGIAALGLKARRQHQLERTLTVDGQADVGGPGDSAPGSRAERTIK